MASLDQVNDLVVDRLLTQLGAPWTVLPEFPAADGFIAPLVVVEPTDNDPMQTNITLDPRYAQFQFDITLFADGVDERYAQELLKTMADTDGPLFNAFLDLDLSDALGKLTSYFEFNTTSRIEPIRLFDADYFYFQSRLVTRAR